MSVCGQCRDVLLRRLRTRLGLLRSGSALHTVQPSLRRSIATFSSETIEDGPYIRRIASHDRRPDHAARVLRHRRPANLEASIAKVLDSEITPEMRRRLRMELLWLKDPAKLGRTIDRLLAEDNLQKALNLARLASANETKPVIAWNKVVAYIAMNRDYKSAFKVFNEMKKRAQFPDSYTITHLLRGLAQPGAGQEQVRLAVHLLDSLDAPNSKIKRDIIHTNTALQVCAIAGDLDNMWMIAGKLPDHGRGAADQITFAIILNAIRKDVESNWSAPDYQERLLKALEDGRSIWDDVTKRWQQGRMLMDHSLLGSYVRLLLLSKQPDDVGKIFEIIDSTTGMSAAADSSISSNKPPPRLIKPGNGLLAVILDVFSSGPPLTSDAARALEQYWKTCVEVHRVNPDLYNYRQLLRIYDKAILVQPARETLEAMLATAKNITPKAASDAAKPTAVEYNLVLAACAKMAGRMWGADDRTAFENASIVFGLMVKNLKNVEAASLAKFVHCAVASRNTQDILTAFAKVMPVLDDIMTKKQVVTGNHQANHPMVSVAYLIELLNVLRSTTGQAEIKAILGEKGESQLGSTLESLKSLHTQLLAWKRASDKRSVKKFAAEEHSLKTLKRYAKVIEKRHSTIDDTATARAPRMRDALSI